MSWDGRERRHESCGGPGCSIAQTVAEQAAHLAAEEATGKVFAIMGVDLANPEKVEEFRRDLRFSGELRRQLDDSRQTITRAALITIVGAAGLALWLGIKAKLGLGD